MGKDNFSCIISFYNEGELLLRIIEAVSPVRAINQIIVVDDGSTNKMFELIQEKFKSIELIRLFQNQGKAGAIKTGLERVRNKHVVMMDADYQNIIAEEIETVLTKYINSGIDMLLLQVKGGNNGLDKLLRKEVLFTGFRILKREDLAEVLNLHPKGYQLEVAINEYMKENNKKVAWLPTDILNIHKSKKWGAVNGLFRSIKMELSILFYLGIIKFFRQVLSFAKEELV